MQPKVKTFRTASLLLLLAAGVLLFFSSWPIPRERETIPFPLAYSLDQPGLAPVQLDRVVFTSIPEKMRVGQKGEIRLEFAPSTSDALTSTQAPNGVPVSNMDTYLLEVRLEIPGIVVNPEDSVIQPIIEGHTLRYTWELETLQKGNYAGKMWVYLLVVPEGSFLTDRRPVLALPVEIEAVDMPIFNVKILRIAGGLCIAGALILGILRLVLMKNPENSDHDAANSVG